MTLIAVYFSNYVLRKRWLDKYLKSPVWEDPQTSNMVNGPKHFWNLRDSVFIIFIDHCEEILVWKNLCRWYVKS